MSPINELEKKLSSVTDVEKRMQLLFELLQKGRRNYPDAGLKFAEELLALAEKKGNVSFKAFALFNIAAALEPKGDYPTVINQIGESKTIYLELKKDSEVINCNNLLAKIYSNLGDYTRALDLLDESLKLSQDTNIIEAEAKTLNAISVIYQRSGNAEKAEEFAKKCLSLAEKSGAQQTIAIAKINLGNAYGMRNNWDAAIEEWTGSISILKKTGEEHLEASALGNIGIAYMRTGELEKAKINIERCLEVKQRLNDLHDVARSFHNLGTVYWKMGNTSEARKLYDRAIKIVEESKAKSVHAAIYKDLSIMLKELGEYKEALEVSEKYHELEKSLFTDNMNVKTQSLEMRFEVDRMEKENEIYRLKNIDLASANEQITAQKEVIEQKNKDITDSILYAKRIQEAVLPSLSTMENLFSDFFILYIPKDIVSGDFYWAAEKDGRKILAVADCTGHGVPGAIMSVMGSSFLSEIVGEKGVSVPSVALGLLRKKVVAAMQQGKDSSGAQDGMDIVFCSFEELENGEKTMLASCANNPIWIVRDGKLKELEPDKFPVGIFPGEQKPFTIHEHQLKKDDFIYLFTDGFADQFGGPKEKKFGYKKMREEFLRIHKFPAKKQQKELEKLFNDWKNNFDQVDDVLVVGMRV